MHHPNSHLDTLFTLDHGTQTRGHSRYLKCEMVKQEPMQARQYAVLKSLDNVKGSPVRLFRFRIYSSLPTPCLTYRLESDQIRCGAKYQATGIAVRIPLKRSRCALRGRNLHSISQLGKSVNLFKRTPRGLSALSGCICTTQTPSAIRRTYYCWSSHQL
jgi:hypothetical protein